MPLQASAPDFVLAVCAPGPESCALHSAVLGNSGAGRPIALMGELGPSKGSTLQCQPAVQRRSMTA